MLIASLPIFTPVSDFTDTGRVHSLICLCTFHNFDVDSTSTSTSSDFTGFNFVTTTLPAVQSLPFSLCCNISCWTRRILIFPLLL